MDLKNYWTDPLDSQICDIHPLFQVSYREPDSRHCFSLNWRLDLYSSIRLQTLTCFLIINRLLNAHHFMPVPCGQTNNSIPNSVKLLKTWVVTILPFWRNQPLKTLTLLCSFCPYENLTSNTRVLDLISRPKTSSYPSFHFPTMQPWTPYA